VLACLELHTFSSLKSDFLPQYKNSMDKADKAIVYYNPHTIELKRLDPVSPEQVAEAFGKENLVVGTSSFHFMKEVESTNLENTVLLLMSSGNFDGIEFNSWVGKLLSGLE
jgi:UDP-N-acetylmuramate: L-alanyl-gamma-D-glutamyl-meso-diaminopimelate ligase